MRKILHKAESRGHVNFGWLDSHHTFSFGSYHNPERIQFGALRVLNDDIVEGGMGFGTHPHDNMEIVSIPLSGDLEHKDSMGNVAEIRQNDVQIMSAGTGIAHSEYNKNKNQKVNFLQIWILPKLRNITPRYSQITFRPEDRKNKLQMVVSPQQTPMSVQINQDAWFYLGSYDQGTSFEYKVNQKGNGVYLFLIEGEISFDGQILSRRDGMAVSDTDSLTIEVTKKTELLLIEVPLSI